MSTKPKLEAFQASLSRIPIGDKTLSWIAKVVGSDILSTSAEYLRNLRWTLAMQASPRAETPYAKGYLQALRDACASAETNKEISAFRANDRGLFYEAAERYLDGDLDMIDPMFDLARQGKLGRFASEDDPVCP